MKYFYSLLTLLIPGMLLAENIRFSEDSDTLTSTMKTEGYYDADVDILGIPEQTMHLSWKVLDRKENKEWDLSVCDFGACYIGVPEGGDMDPATSADDVFFKFTVNPMGKADDCWYTIRVYDKNDETNADTITMLFKAQPTSVGEINKEVFSIYPNPSTGLVTLNLDGDFGAITNLNLVDINGKNVMSAQLDGLKQSQQLDLTSIPRGTYLFVLSNERSQYRSTFIKN